MSKYPSLPQPPAAPCTVDAFISWAEEVIRLLQPHAAADYIADTSRPVVLRVGGIGGRTLGQWNKLARTISLRQDLVAKGCQEGTWPVIDTLLHECAHMLAPPGSAHGKHWKTIARAL